MSFKKMYAHLEIVMLLLLCFSFVCDDYKERPIIMISL